MTIPKPTIRPTRPAVAVTTLLVLVLLGGCVSVPSSGPVEPGRLASGSPSARVEIEAAPPARDATPALIVEGFLHAMSNGQGNYDIARQYLVGTARDNWHPERGVLIYDGNDAVDVQGDRVVLSAPLSGTLADDGSFGHTEQNYRIDFGLVRDDNGQWRISNPPNGLLISQYLFEKFYRRYNLYFFDPDFQTLVPDPIYLPRSQQPSTGLIRALLRGPTRWLAPAVNTAVPEGTALDETAALGDGVIEVSLGQQATGLNEAQRSRMAAQIVWTLAQLDGVSGVRLTAGGGPLAVREQDSDGILPIRSFVGYNPVQRSNEDLFVATRTGVATLAEGTEPATEPIDGPCGRLDSTVQSMAVRRTDDGIATAVVSDGRMLLCSPGAEQAVQVKGLPRTGVRTPQYTRFGELWTAADSSRGTLLYRIVDGRAREVEAPGMASGELRAFRISPDGTRMAMIRRIGSSWYFGVARIVRGEQTRVEGWQRVDLTNASDPLALGWSDATTLVVLASDAPRTPAKPYLVRQDGADLRQIGTGDWNPAQLAVAPGESAPEAVVVSKSGELWRYQDDDRWPFLTDGITTASYPG